MLKKLVLVFCIFCCTVVPAYGLTLKVAQPGDSTPLSIELHATKRTEHALAVKTTDGTIYYADMMPVEQSFSGGMFVRIDNQVYQIGPTPKFFVTTTPDTKSFSFAISAAGSFIVDWGDGNVQEIVRTDTNVATYSHTYSTAGKYTIGIGGRATGYTTDNVAAVSFENNLNIAGIDGSLGAIFSTIGDGSDAGQQPRFWRLFAECTNLTGAIPDNLFTGVNGQMVSRMFGAIFRNCIGLTSIPENLFASIKGTGVSLAFFDAFYGTGISEIPEKLFASITGSVGQSMFQGTFYACRSLTRIPKKLFASYTGPVGVSAFAYTFLNCSSLTTIPEDLFVTISGPVTEGLFVGTFSECTALTSIPENLFGNLYGSLATNTFSRTFHRISSARGSSAKINGKYLYEIWPDATTEQVGECYTGATSLTDYDQIPAVWK